MDTMVSDHQKMVADYEARMQDAQNMLDTYKTHTEKLTENMRHAQNEAEHNAMRLNKVVATVKNHLGVAPKAHSSAAGFSEKHNPLQDAIDQAEVANASKIHADLKTEIRLLRKERSAQKKKNK